MDKETLLEVKKVVEVASDGNWFPFVVVAACLGLIVLLFIYILNIKDKAHTERHNKHEGWLEKLTENSTQMGKMLAVHESELQNFKKN